MNACVHFFFGGGGVEVPCLCRQHSSAFCRRLHFVQTGDVASLLSLPKQRFWCCEEGAFMSPSVCPIT